MAFARLTLGGGLGVGVGDLLISAICAAPWQIALVVTLAMSLTVFPDGGAVIAIQAAIWGFLVGTLYLPGLHAEITRLVDGLIGCAIWLLFAGVPTELVSTPAVIVTGTRGALSECHQVGLPRS